MRGEDTPDQIFVDVDSEGLVDLLCNPWAFEPWVVSLPFDDGLDEFARRRLGPGFRLLADEYK